MLLIIILLCVALLGLLWCLLRLGSEADEKILKMIDKH